VVPAPTTTKTVALKVPTVYGMTAEEATAALTKAGFIASPSLSTEDGTDLTDASGYTVASVSDEDGSLDASPAPTLI
jgi:beta-lactam-binding protein with PASTA domain